MTNDQGFLFLRAGLLKYYLEKFWIGTRFISWAEQNNIHLNIENIHWCTPDSNPVQCFGKQGPDPIGYCAPLEHWIDLNPRSFIPALDIITSVFFMNILRTDTSGRPIIRTVSIIGLVIAPKVSRQPS
ncbi:Protein of unknown function [Cotesia congregata]|uniref:Uncharacterized protein n=1 Tax=Cotesia congregata TaxID=51543 RepID=A0A8J2HCM1_COTCN|nr:Protein of unknown function [Cotesia congregata]